MSIALPVKYNRIMILQFITESETESSNRHSAISKDVFLQQRQKHNHIDNLTLEQKIGQLFYIALS